MNRIEPSAKLILMQSARLTSIYGAAWGSIFWSLLLQFLHASIVVVSVLFGGVCIDSSGVSIFSIRYHYIIPDPWYPTIRTTAFRFLKPSSNEARSNWKCLRWLSARHPLYNKAGNYAICSDHFYATDRARWKVFATGFLVGDLMCFDVEPRWRKNHAKYMSLDCSTTL